MDWSLRSGGEEREPVKVVRRCSFFFLLAVLEYGHHGDPVGNIPYSSAGTLLS
jgi:hypothetical protein